MADTSPRPELDADDHRKVRKTDSANESSLPGVGSHGNRLSVVSLLSPTKSSGVKMSGMC